MIDWKKVAANRLKWIKLLERRLEVDRLELARAAVGIMQRQIHARCLVSISSEEWRDTFAAIQHEIAEQ